MDARLLMSLSARLDVQGGMFFASCFGRNVPPALVSEITVHGAGSNEVIAGFASRTAKASDVPLEIEHWDEIPPDDGTWASVVRSRLYVDTSGTVEFFSGDSSGIEFPIARGYYEIEAASGPNPEADPETPERWRVRVWVAQVDGPQWQEIADLAHQAR